MATFDLGKIRPVDKGEWDAAYPGGYDILDIVTKDNGSYMSKIASNTAPVTDRNRWIPLLDSTVINTAVSANPQSFTDAQKLQARLNIEASGIPEEEVVATDMNGLFERVAALEETIRKMELNKIQVDTIDILKDLNYQGRPLFIVSNVAPAVVPDGVPQFYINTATGDFYCAKNSNSVSDWILK